jgi:hypothetical protein
VVQKLLGFEYLVYGIEQSLKLIDLNFFTVCKRLKISLV